MESRIDKIMRKTKQSLKRELLYCSPKSRPRKILFDHLPKCGGSTINAYLEEHYPKRKTFSMDSTHPAESIKRFTDLPERTRYGYELVKGHFAHELVDYVHPDCLKATVFREPVDRIISHYFFVRRTPEHYLHSRILETDMSLEEYATSNLSDELRNWYVTHFTGLGIQDAERNPEQSVTRALEVILQQYDIIGFLDDFPAFAETLRTQANLRYAFRNKRVNVTTNRPDIREISESTIRKIRETNHLDIVLYSKLREARG